MQARRTRRFIAQRQEPSNVRGKEPLRAQPDPRWTGHDPALAAAIPASRRTVIDQRSDQR